MNAALRIGISVAALALAGFAIFALVDRSSVAERAAERRALLTRDAELTRMALTPGSALACLDGSAGETVENSCEKRVFATAESTAAAVGYMGARLKLLADAAGLRDSLALLTASRRAVALDRYGFAAHVLAIRDGCTADKCEAFALIDDASALKANLRAQVYDQYVSRYAAAWSEPVAPAEKPAAVSAVPAAPAPHASVTASGQTPVPAVKPGEHWDFPSAASIPAVSIMGAEPPLPKGADAQAQAPSQAPTQAPSQAPAKPASNAKAPAPPKTPLPQAAPSATR
jgi:hypothetical protein